MGNVWDTGNGEFPFMEFPADPSAEGACAALLSPQKEQGFKFPQPVKFKPSASGQGHQWGIFVPSAVFPALWSHLLATLAPGST